MSAGPQGVLALRWFNLNELTGGCLCRRLQSEGADLDVPKRSFSLPTKQWRKWRAAQNEQVPVWHGAQPKCPLANRNSPKRLTEHLLVVAAGRSGLG